VADAAARAAREDGPVTRIIAGVAGGRRIETPRGADTRPTSDRVREALFGSLDARGLLDGAVVVDLFAGSGALGLEAASRGAQSVVLVESGREAAAVARRNAVTLGLDGVRVVQAPVQRYLATAGDPPADLALLDPPYAFGEAELAAVLAALDDGRLAPGALVVVEREARAPEPAWPAGWTGEGARRYGGTALWWATARLRP
jgi:16S rRNA (guanine966-N2)-methyltransferase